VSQLLGGWTTSRPIRAITEKSGRYWLILGIVFVLARIATWGYPFDSDHWIFYYVGHDWIVNGGQLYVTAWDHKPPMIFLFNGVMSLFLGDNIVLHRVWLTAFALLDTWLFYLVARRLMPSLLAGVKSAINPGTAVKLTLLLYVFLRNLSQFAANGNTTENYGLVFLLGMIWAYLRFLDNKQWGWLVLAGTFCGSLFWLKGNLILLGGVIGVLLLIQGWQHKGRLAGQVSAFVAPIVAISAGWATYFWAQGTLNDFVVASFTFSSKYASSAWAGKVSVNLLLVATTFALLIPVLAFFAVYLRDVKAQWRSAAYQLVGLSFVVGLGLITAVGSFYPYYLLIIMPFMVLIIMYGLFRLDALSRLLRGALVVVLALTLAANYAISLRQLLNNYAGVTKVEAAEYMQAANYVKAHTTADQKVFAYDYGATFYELAQRQSAARFISASHLLLDYRDKYGFGFDDEFLSQLEKTQAPYIVLNDDSRDLYFTNTPVATYIKAHYAPVQKFGAIEVLQRVR
jgi:4-amino-4-deoxy-L-arabinose transferase-like glycosyltransferase